MKTAIKIIAKYIRRKTDILISKSLNEAAHENLTKTPTTSR
jgi:hypothetical protein